MTAETARKRAKARFKRWLKDQQAKGNGNTAIARAINLANPETVRQWKEGEGRLPEVPVLLLLHREMGLNIHQLIE
jgi:hypothetical protein